ncbi:hypothetical protein GGR56DRAFT_625092 [Xylariaceae sp. FL0804]|nr:hypothetical protein GGR56DRAFT_625092 [Xylariaceae sp. FL0804]
MQNEEFEQDFAAGTPQQQHMPNFAATPVDMYGVPLPMPATAPVYTDSRIFWDNDMGGMDLDFSGVGTAMFQHPTHRPVTSLDWGKSSDIPQDSSVAPSQLRQTQENHPPPRKERMLAPKPPASSADLGMTDTAMFAASFPTHVEDTLGMLGSCGGVDPGLLFTQAPPLGMDSMTVDPMAQQPLLQPLSVPEPIPVTMKEPKRGQVRRSASGKKRDSSKKIDRASASSPIKSSSGHAGLSRSSSENKGRRPAKRPILPNLAPAVPQGPTSSTSTRPAAQGSGANGRRSPKKHQHRLSSLASIPERSPPRTRTSVKFTIDSRGRARAETTVTVDGGGGQAPAMLRRHPDESSRSKKWDSSEEESSSSDDEPIVIPSRNSSFAMPQPRKPALAHSLNASQGSFGELNNASSLGIYHNEPAAASSQNEVESEAETVLNVPSGAGGRRGDATSELRKVRESRQKKVAALNTNHHYSSGPPYSAGSTMSPTTLTDASLPTPLTDGGNQIRCVCHTTQSHINGDGYMVQCEACEMWLHGKCINITRQTLPCVYICAFCANTPNAHRMRGQDVRRSMGVPNMGASAASPLAHKSFKSFR